MSVPPPPPLNKMPRPQQVAPTKPASPVNHPAVAEYVTEFNRMAHLIDQLTSENKQLKYDLDVARNAIAELQHISDHERNQKEMYQRWASRCDTLAGEVAHMANQLRSEAERAAAPAEQITGPPVASAEELEQEVAAIAKKFAPKPFVDGQGPVIP